MALRLWVNGWWPTHWDDAVAKAEKMGKRVYAALDGTPTDTVLYTPTTLNGGTETAYGWE